MAIELPSASAASVGTAGRRARARVPDVGDVPQVRVAGDPGVQVPNFAQFAGGLEDVGGVISEVGQRIKLRQEGLARDSDDTAYAGQLSEFLRDLDKVGDAADQDEIDEIGERATQLQGKILSDHKGGGTSRAMLENRLERRRVGFADTLAVKNIEASSAKQLGSFKKRTRAMTAEIEADPDVLESPDIGAVFRKHDATLEDEIAFLNPSPALRRAFLEMGRENIVQSMATALIREGDFERVKLLLNDPELKDDIDPALRREMAARVGAAQRKLTEARQVGEIARETARAVLGPNASAEDIDRAAAQIVGIDESEGNTTFNMGGSMGVVTLDRNGLLLNRIPGPTPEQQAETAGLIKKAELTARMEFLQQVLGFAGASLLPEPTETVGEDDQTKDSPEAVESRALLSPFGDEVPASPAAQTLARMLLASRNLLLVGSTAEANFILSQARFFAENSPELRRERDLDKPISPDFASVLGVPAGTPLRDVMNRVPPSPEELAEERAIGAARGGQRIAGEEQLGFIDEARIMIGDLLEEVRNDPGIVGVRGSLRATGQTAFGVLGDLGLDAFVETARSLAFENTELGLDEITQMFNSPTLSVLDVLENSIGLILARLRQPTGRLLASVIKLSIKDVQLKGLKSSTQIENRLNFVLDQLNRRAEAIQQRFNLPAEEPEASDMPRFRIEGGKLVPVGP